MLETSHFWGVGPALVVAGMRDCAAAGPRSRSRCASKRLKGPLSEVLAAAAAEEAKALLAQAETDIQRARAKRALWQQAWEDLVVAREAVAGKDHARAARMRAARAISRGWAWSNSPIRQSDRTKEESR